MKRIDFHAHYLSPGFVDHLASHYDGMGDGVATPDWSAESALAMMAQQDIAYELVSISSPQISSDDRSETVELAQEVNEFGRDFTRKYPKKLGFMASLPLPYIDDSVKTVETAQKNDLAKGFVLETNTQGIYLGNERLEPVMKALNEVHALVTIHPTQPNPLSPSANQQTPTPLMEFFFDTTRAVANMSEKTIFSRYPNITWIIPHAGAVLPVIAQRITIGSSVLKTEIPRDNLLDIMHDVYFDLAGVPVPYQLPVLLQLADSNKLLFGSDFPYTPASAVGQSVQQLETTELADQATKEKFMFENGQKLLASHGIQID